MGGDQSPVKALGRTRRLFVSGVMTTGLRNNRSRSCYGFTAVLWAVETTTVQS